MPKIGQTVGDAATHPEKATCAPRTSTPRTKQPHRPEARTERARLAYLAGDAARDSHCITAQAHHLYEILLRYAGCRSFSWVGVTRLAEDMRKSERSIDRLLKELGEEGAGLIRRERRVGATSYTFITVFERLEQAVEERSAEQLVEAAADAVADGHALHAAALLHHAAERVAMEPQRDSDAAMWPQDDRIVAVPDGESENDPYTVSGRAGFPCQIVNSFQSAGFCPDAPHSCAQDGLGTGVAVPQEEGAEDSLQDRLFYLFEGLSKNPQDQQFLPILNANVAGDTNVGRGVEGSDSHGAATERGEKRCADNPNIIACDYRPSAEPPPAFFCASECDKYDVSDTPKMACLTTMKKRSLNVKEESTSPLPPASLPTRRARAGGGGRYWRNDEPEPVVIENAITERLRSEGVVDVHTLNELADRPLEQIESAARIVRALRSPNDPRRPGLLVKILRLQAHGHDQAAADGQGAPAAEQPSEAAPPSEQEHAPAAEAQAERTEPSAADLAAWATVWQAVQAELAATLDPMAYATWIAALTLADLSEDEAVIATPNVFVRDEIEERYYEQISAALAEALGRCVAVALFINPAADALRALR